MFIFLLLLSFLRWFVDKVQQGGLQVFLFFAKPVLLPGVVEDLGIELVTLHALLEVADADSVVWSLLELQASAVLHVVLELVGLALAEVIQGGFDLLLFDSVVFLVFGASWKSLPWKLAHEEVK